MLRCASVSRKCVCVLIFFFLIFYLTAHKIFDFLIMFIYTQEKVNICLVLSLSHSLTHSYLRAHIIHIHLSLSFSLFLSLFLSFSLSFFLLPPFFLFPLSLSLSLPSLSLKGRCSEIHLSLAAKNI